MDNSEEPIKQIARGAMIIFIGTFISKLLSYLFRLVSARLGSADYGLLTLAISIIVMVSIFVTLGLDHGIYRYVAYYKEKNLPGKVKGTIYSTIKWTMLASVIATAILFFASDFITARFFPNMDQYKLSTMLKIISLSIPFLSLSKMLNTSFKSFQRPEYEMYTKNIAEPLSKFLLTLAFVLLGFGIIIVSSAYVAAVAISSLIGILLLKKLLNKYVGNAKSEYSNKELFRYSLPLIFIGLFLTLTTSVDTFMLGHYKTEAEVGIYNAATPTAMLIYMFPYAILALFLPVLMGLDVREEKKAFEDVYKTVTKWIFLVNLILASIFAIYSKEVLSIFFGQEYAAGSTVLVILLCGFFVNFLFYPAENVLLIHKKSKWIFYNSAATTVLNIILNYTLIPKYSIEGAAVATSISFAVWGTLNLIESYYLTRIMPFKASYVKIIFSVAIGSLAFLKLKPYFAVSNLLILGLAASGMVILVFMLLLLTRSFEKDDKLIFKIIKRKMGIKSETIDNYLRD